MADITLKGTDFTGVETVTLPKTGGGTVTFAAGGGGSNVTLVASTELTVNTTSTTATGIGNIDGTIGARTAAAIIYVRVRDKAGKRAGYFYGSDSFFLEAYVANNSTSAENRGVRVCLAYNSSGQFSPNLSTQTSGYGVYPTSIYSTGSISMYARYNSSYSGTINGTYVIDVFAIEMPDGEPLFAYGE